MNLCIAVDGSGSISSQGFENERKFVSDVVSVIRIDWPVDIAAIQYAHYARSLKLTGNIFPAIFPNMDNTKQIGGPSYIAAGINYCFSQLWSRRSGETNKILLMVDKDTYVGTSSVKRANLFRRIGGELSVVAGGFSNTTVVEKISLHPENFYNVSSFSNVLQLQSHMKRLLRDICG